MSCNLRCHDSLLYIINIRKCQVLCWCYIAKECCSCRSCNSSTDSRCDVIISWSNICNYRSQYIEWSSHTYCLLYLHISSYLIHRHMTRSLNHYLNISFPCTLSKLSKTNKFLYLTYVTSVSNTAWTAGITKGNSYIIFTTYFKYFIIVFIKWILFACHTHPCKYK